MKAEVLVAMAFDRYVVICAPLHCMTILTSCVLLGMSLYTLICLVLLTLPMIYLIYRLPFCQAHVIIFHSYCEPMGIAKLSCGNIYVNGNYRLFVVSLFILLLVLVGVSYIYMVCDVFHLPSQDVSLKTLSTCSSNVAALCVFYLLSVFSFLTHQFGQNISCYIHILVANLYLVIPP